MPGSFCWSLYSLELFIRNIPVPTRAWMLFYSSMAILAAFFYTRAVHETVGVRNRLPGRLILAAGVLNVVGVLFASPRVPAGELRLGLVIFFGRRTATVTARETPAMHRRRFCHVTSTGTKTWTASTRGS